MLYILKKQTYKRTDIGIRRDRYSGCFSSITKKFTSTKYIYFIFLINSIIKEEMYFSLCVKLHSLFLVIRNLKIAILSFNWLFFNEYKVKVTFPISKLINT